jgi:hypothetical protein
MELLAAASRRWRRRKDHNRAAALGAGGPGLGLLPRHTLGRQCGVQRGEIIGGIDCGRRHEPDYRVATTPFLPQL